MKTLYRASCLLFLTATALGCATTPEGGKSSGEEVVITVFGLADFHGQLRPGEVDGRPIGGAGWIAAYLDAVRKANPAGVIALDTGDSFTGPLVATHKEGAAIIEYFNQIGIDAMALGNHEFDYGPVGPLNRALEEGTDPRGALKARAKEAKFPILAANIYEQATGGRFAPEGIAPYTIIERHGVKVAVIGLTTIDLPKITLPHNLKGLMFKHHVTELAELIPEVRQKGATVVVIVGHMGGNFDEDAQEYLGEVADLARALDPGDVDLIVGGHTTGPFGAVINGIPVVKPEGYARGFSRVDLTVDKGNGRVNRSKTVIHPTTRFWHGTPGAEGKVEPISYLGVEIKPLTEIDKAIEPYFRAVDALKAVPIGEATEAVTRAGNYNSALGNLVTDAMRLFDESVEVALFNSGGIRDDLPAGKLTFGHLYGSLPFDNTVCLVRLSGQQLKEVLEHGLSGEFGNLEVSGIKVLIDAAQPVGSRVVWIIGPKGVVLASNDFVEVAINDFMLAGGDGYRMIPRSTAVETGADVRELVVRLVELRGKKVAPDATPRYERYDAAETAKPAPVEKAKPAPAKKGKK